MNRRWAGSQEDDRRRSMVDIRHYLVISAPAEKVYKAVTEQGTPFEGE